MGELPRQRGCPQAVVALTVDLHKLALSYMELSPSFAAARTRACSFSAS